MAMDIAARKKEAVEHLMRWAGLGEERAEKLVDAVCDAAQYEVLQMISGGEPYPTSMSELRLLRVRYVFQAAGRRLTTQEAAVLFRLTDTSADTLLTRMQAVYPDAVTAAESDEAMRAAAHLEKSGNARRWSYLIRFDNSAAWARAIRKLREAGCNDLREDARQRTIEPPRKFGPADNQLDSAAVLGIEVAN